MQRAPANGGQVGLTAAVDPSSPERLQHVGTMLCQKKPWPAFLLVGARATEEWEACPTPVQEALAWMATSAVGLLDIASVGPLEPVCQAFKALIEAAEGAAESQEKLQGLVSRCAFLTTVLIQHGRAVDPLAQVQKPIGDFVVTTNKVAVFAEKWSRGGKCRAFFCHRTDLSTLADFEEGLRRIGADINLVDGLEHHQQFIELGRALLPPSLPDMAAVPAGALVLPHSYVERAAVQEVADGLTNPEEPHSSYTVVGMGGWGKSVLASAVVRRVSVRKHFRGGIFWMRVGRDAKNSLLALLEDLARKMGAAPTDTPHGVPHVLDSLEKVQQHLTAVASTGNSPRLVVLDDVWEREVMEALLPLGVKVLVTTRDRSVVGVPTGCLKLGDMTEEEALELLLKTSRTVGQPGDAVRTQMTKVVALCGRLPLVLAIAGSMAVVKGKGLTAGAWEVLIEALKDVSEKMRGRGEQSTSLKVVLETSLDALTWRKQDFVFKLAVLAPGAGAPIDMLLNLWEIQEVDDTREEADGLVSKCLLQDVGRGGYRVHDLVLEFLKDNIKTAVVKKATTLQAHFLGRLDVLNGYKHPEHGAGSQGLFVLDALWRSVETLSGDPELEVASYSTSLVELESCEATTDVASSYSSVGFFFNIQGKYELADPLYLRAIKIWEAALGPDHPQVATGLNNRAGLLSAQGKYAEAQPLFERALAIREGALGVDHPATITSRAWMADLYQKQGFLDKASPLLEEVVSARERVQGRDHPDVASALNNRAVLLESQGKYDEAGPLYERSHAIREKALGPDHPAVAESLNNRALLLEKQGKVSEADRLNLRALEIWEKTLGPDHPDVATALTYRAALLQDQGKYQEAESLNKRSLAMRQKALGPDHPAVAESLNNRAGLLQKQGRYDEAEPIYASLYARMATFEKNLGREHPVVATAFNNWAEVLKKQGKYDEAEPLYVKAIAIAEKTLSPDHPDLACYLHNQAELLKAQGNFTEAERLYIRSHATREKILDPEHRHVAETLNGRADLLRMQGKYDEAEPLCVRAIAIGETALGPDHPDLAEYLDNRAELFRIQGMHEEADALYQRSLAMREKALGPDHPDVAQSLNNLAVLSSAQGKYDEADPLYQRALAIDEKVLGPEHPNVARDLNNWAVLLYAQENYMEAFSLCERALAIRTKKLVENHPDTISTQNNLEAVRQKV